MYRGASDRLAAVVAAQLQRVVAIDNAIVGPVKLGLLAFVGCKILQRSEIGTGVERHNGEAVFGELAGHRAAAGAGADYREVDRLGFGIFTHRHPSTGAKNIRCTSMPRAGNFLGIIEHGG